MNILTMLTFAVCCVLAAHYCSAQGFDQSTAPSAMIAVNSYLPEPMTLTKRDTIPSNRDKHVLLSGGGGVFTGSGKGYFSIVGLEYPLDSARKWNIEVNWYYYFNTFSSANHSSGLLCFRRYLKSKESPVRPSIHFGFGIEPSLDLGAGVDYHVIERALQLQLCARKLISLYVGRQNVPTTPFMLSMSVRVLL